MACAAAVAASLCAAPAQADTPFERGMVLTGWTAGTYQTARADRVTAKIAAAGTDHVAVFTQWFLDSATSSHLAPDDARTPSDASIEHAAAEIRAQGMQVTIKPQIGIKTGAWIGGAHPADLDAFWADYRTMLLHYADLAERLGATTLVVGTEMKTLSGDEDRWRSLIAEVRDHFHGALTYAANYDEYQSVPFWDALDYIGIDAYFGLADDADPAPPLTDLVAAWTTRGHLARIAAVSRRFGKQVLFTEIGYRSIRTTAAHPNLWNVVAATDPDAQANAYQAFYTAVATQPWMAGVYWWEVNADSWTAQDYSPLGKAAGDVMAAWNRAQIAPSASPAAEAPPGPVTPTAPAPSTPTEAAATETLLPQPTAAPPSPSLLPAQPRTAIHVTLRANRLAGAVTPYTRTCNGKIQLRIRVKRAGKWRYMNPPAPLRPTANGAFARRVPAGQLRVQALYSGSCAKAASAWVTAAR